MANTKEKKPINERFADARDKVVLGDSLIEGIGCLSEKTIHAVLKLYLEPDTSYHEKNVVGKMVADIRNEAGIFEIQTKNFGYMKKKLERFLEIDSVTVVYPCIENKYIIYTNEKGEPTRRTRSPQKGRPLSVFYELYQIREFLCHENLRIMVFMLDADEYRLPIDKNKRGRKNKAPKFDALPISLNETYILKEPRDYLSLLPPLPDVFTRQDLAKAAKIDATLSYGTLTVLSELGVVTPLGKEGRSYKYKISDQYK